MKKEEIIRRYGEEEYRGRLENNRQWQAVNPERVKVNNQESCQKGGKHYEATLKWHTTGLSGEREKVRKRHGYRYRQYKKIIAPDSQLHHEWIPETANYRGMALVEADQHMHGFIDVIQILEGKITVFTEAEIKIGGKQK